MEVENMFEFQKEKTYLKLVRESISLINPIYVTYNGKAGKRTISVVEICLSIRSKKPSILRNKRGKEFKFKNISDESKHVINEIVEGNKRYL